MGKGRSKEKTKPEGETPRFDNPFAGLAGLRERLPAGDVDEGEAGDEAKEANAPRSPRRAVVRYQRKGRGGKEVTLVEQLGLPTGELERWLKDLKRHLGCGGSAEGNVLALQGDQRERLPAVLERWGVPHVTVS